MFYFFAVSVNFIFSTNILLSAYIYVCIYPICKIRSIDHGLCLANCCINFVYITMLIVNLLLFTVGFPILFLFLWAHPYERGFFCNDESLLHPFHESTVPSIYLYFVGLGMNCFVVNILINQFFVKQNCPIVNIHVFL